MESVNGIGGVFFKSRDPETLAAWYRENLGVPVEEDAHFAMFRWRERTWPEHIGSTTWALFPEDTRYFDPSDAPFMINYRVDDLDAFLRTLREAGADVDERVEEYEYGRFGWIRDPEGNRIEVWEPLGEPGAESADPLAAVGEAHGSLVQALMEGDAAALDGGMADDFVGYDVEIGAFTKPDVLKAYSTGAATLMEHEGSEHRLRSFGTSGVVQGRAAVRGRTGGRRLDRKIRYLAVWALTADGWRLHAAQIAPDAS